MQKLCYSTTIAPTFTATGTYDPHNAFFHDIFFPVCIFSFDECCRVSLLSFYYVCSFFVRYIPDDVSVWKRDVPQSRHRFIRRKLGHISGIPLIASYQYDTSRLVEYRCEFSSQGALERIVISQIAGCHRRWCVLPAVMSDSISFALSESPSLKFTSTSSGTRHLGLALRAFFTFPSVDAASEIIAAMTRMPAKTA